MSSVITDVGAKSPHRLEVLSHGQWIVHNAMTPDEAWRLYNTCAPIGVFVRLYLHGELVIEGHGRELAL